MSTLFNDFLKKILVLTGITAILIVLFYLFKPHYISPALPFLLAFFMAVSVISFKILQKKAIHEPRKFVTGFLAHSVIRMMLYLIIIVSYAFLYRTDAIKFIIGFFILYLVFTGFEVFQFLKLTKRTGNFQK
ncbi:MAG: hypothetical protein K0B15_10865 [Lentimicrobium sp.]|nr:hypothetical protein [Lentimicrobium sp.]